ncbi:hypothetical protein AAFF_G00162560 [Aldrovandia affinis]|uniref:Uncharacterized protein n=1 Tax=Aldrovandia affinis TaxID=143900 RepID=A0AAD7WWE4_9TELE|nr:hypothetical protein AAFF_G00162560 [Aldrovandia affinis]
MGYELSGAIYSKRTRGHTVRFSTPPTSPAAAPLIRCDLENVCRVMKWACSVPVWMHPMVPENSPILAQMKDPPSEGDNEKEWSRMSPYGHVQNEEDAVSPIGGGKRLIKAAN